MTRRSSRAEASGSQLRLKFELSSNKTRQAQSTEFQAVAWLPEDTLVAVKMSTILDVSAW